MALSWLNLLSAPKAAIGNGKRTLGHLASLPRHRGRSKALLRVRALSEQEWGGPGLPRSSQIAPSTSILRFESYQAAWSSL